MTLDPFIATLVQSIACEHRAIGHFLPQVDDLQPTPPRAEIIEIIEEPQS